MLSSYYKGKISFVELMYMPLSYIASLYMIALNRQKAAEADEEERKRQEAEVIEDEMEELM
jgi:hypothetical protein